MEKKLNLIEMLTYRCDAYLYVMDILETAQQQTCQKFVTKQKLKTYMRYVDLLNDDNEKRKFFELGYDLLLESIQNGLLDE